MIETIKFSEVNPISNNDKLKINKEIYSTIKRKDFVLGKDVKKFENEFSKLSGIKYSVGCASGTDALILALMSLNLKKDDEIIVPGMTYVSTGLSVILNNCKLVIADIDNKTGLLSISKVTEKISKNTKVVIPVNLYGQKFDLQKLRKIIGKKIYIIEDSAQSHFAYSCHKCRDIFNNMCCKKFRNEHYADISCYSFYPAKNLGAYGDGGLIATNSRYLYRKFLALRNLGSIKKNKHNIIGINSRLDTIQAIILRIKLRTILKLNDHRRKIAKIYDRNLKKISQIRLTKTSPGSSRHLYVIRVKNRDKLIKYLTSKKILCQIHYPYSLNKIRPLLKKIKGYKILRNSEQWSKECLSLPIHSKLKVRQSYRVINEIIKFFNNK